MKTTEIIELMTSMGFRSFRKVNRRKRITAYELQGLSSYGTEVMPTILVEPIEPIKDYTFNMTFFNVISLDPMSGYSTLSQIFTNKGLHNRLIFIENFRKCVIINDTEKEFNFYNNLKEKYEKI